MKVIIAGSRDITDKKIVEGAIKESGFEITELVCGMARGIDIIGFDWAKLNNIPIKRFYPNWRRFYKAAGKVRNKEMALYADALIAAWDEKSKGTKHMISCMSKAMKPFHIKIWKK